MGAVVDSDPEKDAGKSPFTTIFLGSDVSMILSIYMEVFLRRLAIHAFKPVNLIAASSCGEFLVRCGAQFIPVFKEMVILAIRKYRCISYIYITDNFMTINHYSV